MEVLTKYEVLETKQMSNVEYRGAEAIFTDYLKDVGLDLDVENLGCIYQDGLIYLDYEPVTEYGIAKRIGMVCDRLVVEIEKTYDLIGEETDIGTGEVIMYWLDHSGLEQIGG